jgi:hypothetical protein
MVKSIFLGLCAMLLSSCVSYYPVSNPSGTLLQAVLPADQYKILGTGSGEACGRYLFGFPLAAATGEKNTYQAAVHRAIESKKGNHFIQTTADFSYTGFPLPPYFAIYQEVCVIVEGLVIQYGVNR